MMYQILVNILIVIKNNLKDYSCETCEIEGNNITHNCLTCQSNYPFKIKINNYTNCYKNCNYYYYFDNEYNFHCTNNLSCPEKYSLLIEDERECIKDDTNIYQSSEVFKKKISFFHIRKKSN